MPAIDDRKKEEVEKLYKQGWSARQIAERLGVSLDATYYALRRFNIPRRSTAENNRIIFLNKDLSYSVKKPLSKSDEILKALGVALYWGEGYKTDKSSGIDFANSDPDMIRVFLAFLRTICGIDEERIRILLYCHDAALANTHLAYWSRLTEIPKSQFTKPYISKKLSKRNTGMPHGLIHIRYSDKKLLHLVRSWIQEYANQGRVGTQAVNEGGL